MPAAPLLLVAETTANADMYATSRFLTSDPIIWLEEPGRSAIVVTGFDVALARRSTPADEVWSAEDLSAEVRAAGATYDEVVRAAVLNAVRRFGSDAVRVPPWFPLEHAEHLRANGVAVEIDAVTIADRRRTKSADEVAGLRVVQRSVEEAMIFIRETIGSATPAGDGVLMLDGAPLTVEHLRGAVQTFWVANGVEPLTPIIAPGAQGADPHEHGSGVIRAGEPIVCDLFPRHATSRLYGDMTRTFSFGRPSDEVTAVHAVCREVLLRAIDATRAGVCGKDLQALAADLFRDHGYPSREHPADTIANASAWTYNHGLGHGVGYAVHEAPSAGQTGHDPLLAGETLTIEPGLYASGLGGCRIEDLVIITEDGCENLNVMPYDLVIA